MKGKIAAAALLLGAGGALAQTSSKAAGAAYEAALQCLAQAADRLDDGQSDARTIAAAAAADCREEQKKVIALRRNLDPDHPSVSASIDGAELKAWWLDRATIVSLERRADRKKRAP